MKKSLLTLLIFFTLIFLIINFHNAFSQGKNVRLVGKLNPTGTTSGISYSALWGYSANGREYAILGGNQFIYFIDITDSTNIHVCSAISAIASNWHEMKTYSHYAYSVSEGGMGVQIFDMQNLPNSVSYLGEFHPNGNTITHSIQQDGLYLYLNGGNYIGTQILDLSVNPAQPVVRGLWNTYYVHDCRVRNDTIWAANINAGKLSVVNAINKDSLKTIYSWDNGPNPFPHNIALGPGRKHMYVTDETLTPPGRLKVWDVQDLSDVLLLTTWEPSIPFNNSVIHNVELYGTQLLAAYYSAGVKILDVTTPSSPFEIGWYDTYPEGNASDYNGCWGVYKFPSGKIIVSDRTRGLFVLRYEPPQPLKPTADFMTNKLVYPRGEAVQFIDCSSNSPNSFNWKITGPANYSLSGENATINSLPLGTYTVKLKVTNQYGTDSITKVNCFRVNGSTLTTPVFPAPFLQTFVVNRFDTSTVKFSWSNASPGGLQISYNFRIKKSGQSTETYYLPDNNGLDSAITFRRSQLDSIAHQLGFSGDSVVTVCKVTAYNGLDSLSSGNSLLVTLRSTSVGIQNLSSQIPEKYKLENNYPNPFNPSTNIKFALADKSFTSIIIYDMLGREVQKLLSEELNAGYYNFRFNAENLNSGIYFYKLMTEKFSETKRMVLVK